jgi:uncharacterized protein YecT (DUF1311 family)
MIVTKIQGATWVDWKPVKPESGNEPLDLWRLDLDLDGSGKKRTVVLHESVQTFGSGDVQNRDAYIFDSPSEAEKWLEGTAQSENPVTGTRPYYPGEGITSKTPLYEIYFGGEHKWFAFQGKHYFLTSEEVNADFAGVVQLSIDGSRKLVCIARTSPPQEIYDKFVSEPGLKSYLKVLWTIGHASGGPCGSLGSEYRHDIRAGAAIRRAAVRPWATSNRVEDVDAVYYSYDQRMLKYIETWGYTDVWNHREYQTFLNHVRPAINALAAHYRNVFDVPEIIARQRGQKVFEEITGAHFVIPRDYNPGSYKYPYGHYPIDGGGAVNSQNMWGKTPLMIAAHMNRPDSVKILLMAGADPNLQTTTMNECGLTIERGDRTALLYAEENADIDVMRLLVEAGAKIDAKDSLGNGIDYYLSLNPYLSVAQKKMPIQKLLASTRDDSVSKPSYDCATARQWVDKLVCKDPMLARLDREMAAAFTTWKAKAPSLNKEKADQRAWLTNRAEECRPFEEEDFSTACLQDQTRARIRYLHNRIAE